MSIIIRLQNLSWSANSVDIRQFFQGLAIPEGGVHIVGGAKGDAFIAFATDEDARLAMERNGEVLKDMKVKLLLSSRNEMQRVIEQARNPNQIPPPAVPAVPTAPVISSSSMLDKVVRDKDSKEVPDRHRNRSRSSERRRDRDKSSERDRSRRSNRRDRTPPRKPRDRSRSRERRRGDDRRKSADKREDHSKRDSTRDRDRGDMVRNKNGAPDGGKMPDMAARDRAGPRTDLPPPMGAMPPAMGMDMPLDGGKPWKSTFQSIEKSNQAPVWDTIKPEPKDTLIPNRRDGGLPPYNDPRNMPPVGFPQDPKMGNDFHGYPVPPLDHDSRGPMVPPPFKDQKDSLLDLPPDMMPPFGGQMKPKEPRFEFANNEPMLQDRRPNFGPPPHDRFPSQDMQGFDNRGRAPMDSFQGRGGPPPMDGSFPGGRGGPRHDFEDEDDISYDGMAPEEFHRNMGFKNKPSFYSGPGDFKPTFSDRQSFPNNGPGSNNREFGHDRPFGGGPHRGSSGRHPGMCVELRGLPLSVGYKDIRELFRGLLIPYDGLKIVSEKGQRTGLGYVMFTTERDLKEALSRGGPFINNSFLEVVKCPDEAFHRATDPFHNNNPRQFHSPQAPPGMAKQPFTVMLKGLPYQCKEEDVAQFFRNLKIRDIFIEYDRSGKAMGPGLVTFANEDDYQKALGFSHQKIAHRYIEVLPESGPPGRPGPRHDGPPFPHAPRMMPKVQERMPPKDAPMPPLDPQRMMPGEPPQMIPPPRMMAPDAPLLKIPPEEVPKMMPLAELTKVLPGNEPPPFCVAMHELPRDVQDHDIAQFFSTVGIIPQNIHIMLGFDGNPCGDAFAEFLAPHEFDKALSRHGQFMDNHRVVVRPVQFQEMMSILGRPPLKNNPPFQHSPPPYDQMPQEYDQRRPDIKRRPPMLETPDPKRRPPMLEQPWPEPENDFHANNGPNGGGPRPPLCAVRPVLMMGPPPSIRPPAPTRPLSGPEGFGKPGCVVGISGIPPHAGVGDILDFIKSFKVVKDNVIRRFNDQGCPTGDARVAMATQQDAQRAVRELNLKPLADKPVTVFMI